MKRKKKFVVWLSNRTDRRDDEWVAVWAKSREEAYDNAQFDETRFFKDGIVYTAKEFQKEMGFGA